MNRSKIKIIAKCEFNSSSSCKKTHKILEAAFIRNKLRNNGKYRCHKCAMFDSHLGKKSYFFKYEKNDFFFKEIDSELKAYLLGVIAGDGNVTNGHFSVIANKKDIETLELIKNNISPECPIKSRDNYYTILITSKILYEDLLFWLKIPGGKKSDKITLPNIKKKYLKHFVRGLMDTDGNISDPLKKQKCPGCFYSSTSKKIILQIKNICEKLNIKYCITGIKLKFTGKHALKFLNWIYSDASFALSRKRKFYEIWKTWVPRKGTSIRPIKNKRPPNAILTDEQVIEARKLFKTKTFLIKNLAKKYNISQTAMSDILHYKVYKDLI